MKLKHVVYLMVSLVYYHDQSTQRKKRLHSSCFEEEPIRECDDEDKIKFLFK